MAAGEGIQPPLLTQATAFEAGTLALGQPAKWSQGQESNLLFSVYVTDV